MVRKKPQIKTMTILSTIDTVGTGDLVSFCFLRMSEQLQGDI